MINSSKICVLSRLGAAAMIAVLLATMLAAAVQQPVSAHATNSAVNSLLAKRDHKNHRARTHNSSSTSRNSCASTHTVKSGETLKSIAHDLGVKWRQLARANNIRSPYNVSNGEKLCVPG